MKKNNDTMRKRPSNSVRVLPSPASSCYAARFEQLRAELNERRLTEISEMLTDAGVPEWVMNSDHNGVPSNSEVFRLKWYLARRKNVKAGEIDQKLQRDMKEAYEHARAYRERHNVRS